MTGPYSKRGYDGENGPFVKADVETVLAKAEADEGEDPEVPTLEYQFMVGAELMVAPVLDPDTDTVEVYLPAGGWVHLWTGGRYGSPGHGVYETISAPIGEPAVFYREDSAEGIRFRE